MAETLVLCGGLNRPGTESALRLSLEGVSRNITLKLEGAGLRWACEHKDQLGLQGAGTCRRYKETCGGGHGQYAPLRYACEQKDQLGLQGAGTCRRYHATCG
jgi:hypothetical protein